MKIYGIEETERADYYGSHKYRFYSYFNGTRGAWTYKKEKAIQDGEHHAKLIKAVHGLESETSDDS